MTGSWNWMERFSLFRRMGSMGDSPHDHCHVLKSVKPYEYADAAALVEAFWTEVDRLLEALGMK